MVIFLIIIMIPVRVIPQESKFTPGGFVRGGVYYSTGGYEHDINAAFADLSLTATLTDNVSYKGFADLRFRTGRQFGENSDNVMVREAWCTYYNSIIEISAGKKIIKWGKTDFFTPLSKFNPVDYSFRSPEHEDADLGNLIGEFLFTPAPYVKISVVASPLWNPSVLITQPLELKENYRLTLPEGFGKEGYSSFGVRADFIMKEVDYAIQWFHGVEPMPGLHLDSADFTNIMNPYIYINGVPYSVNSYGADFETALSSVVIRGGLSFSSPEETKEGNEHIPFSQVEWVCGLDWTPGNVHITAEYSGKKVLDFYEPPYEPLIGTEPDIAELAILFSTPGFDPVEYTRLQTEAFNRLYNYQLKEYYHSAGLRIEVETFYGKLIPSLTAMYNFTSRDLAFFPSVKYKPSDGISVIAGLENYSGKNGGLYDIIDDFMNTVFVSVRIDF